MIAGGVLLLVAVSVGLSIFLMNNFMERSGPVVEKIVEIEMEPEPPEIFYHDLQPEFVANFSSKAQSSASYLMTELTVVTEDEEVIGILDKHNPELRNDLLLLFGRQDGRFVTTPEGRTTLRNQTLKTIQNVVEKHHGEPGVKDVFFTRFVVQ